MTSLPFRCPLLAAASLLLAAGCGAETPPDAELPAIEAAAPPPNAMARALEGRGTVFVIRPSELTAERGSWTAAIQDADYVFTTLERGPWDMPGLTTFLQGMRQAAAAAPDAMTETPVLLRVPPLHELGVDSTRARVQEALGAGVAGIIFPHVTSRTEIEQSLDLLGADGWPRNPAGKVVAVHMIEDRASVENARELVSTPGVQVIFLGPMSLTTSFENDSVAVEGAIQSVLAICKETGVACGITAGAEDVAERVRQGFRFLVVREPAVLAAGKAAVGP
jgi:2-keto-3-deoxy-L-rhamnonate aldolase RhmA